MEMVTLLKDDLIGEVLDSMLHCTTAVGTRQDWDSWLQLEEVTALVLILLRNINDYLK